MDKTLELTRNEPEIYFNRNKHLERRKKIKSFSCYNASSYDTHTNIQQSPFTPFVSDNSENKCLSDFLCSISFRFE